MPHKWIQLQWELNCAWLNVRPFAEQGSLTDNAWPREKSTKEVRACNAQEQSSLPDKARPTQWWYERGERKAQQQSKRTKNCSQTANMTKLNRELRVDQFGEIHVHVLQ